MNTYWGSGSIALCPGCFTPRDSPQYLLYRRWVDPSAGLDAVIKRKNPIPVAAVN